MICKILRQFVNNLTGDDKYSRLNRDNITDSIHILLSEKEKVFSGFFWLFLNLD